MRRTGSNPSRDTSHRNVWLARTIPVAVLVAAGAGYAPAALAVAAPGLLAVRFAWIAALLAALLVALSWRLPAAIAGLALALVLDLSASGPSAIAQDAQLRILVVLLT